uniref:Uncharacterized protein n=1 Tax=Panagrolaimus sp. PS1159 TaxID=55785 RepID=A0AC35FBA2_9BILA
MIFCNCFNYSRVEDIDATFEYAIATMKFSKCDVIESLLGEMRNLAHINCGSIRFFNLRNLIGDIPIGEMGV